MQRRKLGRTNLEVSVIGSGYMGLNFAPTPREHRGGRHRVETQDDPKRIDRIKVAGERYPEESEKRTGL